MFALSPGYAHLPDGLKFVYAMVALLLNGKYDVIISAPNRGIEVENLRSLRAELPAVWSDISNAMRGFKDHSLHVLVLDEVLGLELSNFSRKLKLRPGIDDAHRVIEATDGTHFDCIEGHAWMNRVFQERLDEMEVEFFDTGVLKKEETTNEPALSTFVPPNLETRRGAVPAMTYRPQSSSEPGQRTDVQDRMGEAPARRTIHPRRRLGPVNPTSDRTGTSRSFRR